MKRVLPLISKQELFNLMQIADSDKSGTLSRQEFIEFLTAGERNSSVISSSSSSSSSSGSSGSGTVPGDVVGLPTCDGTQNATKVAAILEFTNFYLGWPLDGRITSAEYTGPLLVSVSVADMQILSIDPAQGSFAIRFSTDMYWEPVSCNTAALSTACSRRIGAWYFLTAPEGGDEKTMVQFDATTEGTLVGTQYGIGCVHGDFLEIKSQISQTYDMSYYPFEAHTLQLRLKSYMSAGHVQLRLLERNPVPASQVLPESWQLLQNFTCALSNEEVPGHNPRGGRSARHNIITCSATVVHVDIDWFFNDFFFFLCIVFAVRRSILARSLPTIAACWSTARRVVLVNWTALGRHTNAPSHCSERPRNACIGPLRVCRPSVDHGA